MTELLSAQGLDMNAVGFDAKPALIEFRGIRWFWKVASPSVLGRCDSKNKPTERYVKIGSKINIETRRSTTLKQRVILVQGPC